MELSTNSLLVSNQFKTYGAKYEKRYTPITIQQGLPNPTRKTKFSGANADREIVFPVQLTICRIGSLTRLIHTLAICVTIQ